MSVGKKTDVRWVVFHPLFYLFAISKTIDLGWLIRGGQPYRAFPFSKGSLVIDNFTLGKMSLTVSSCQGPFHKTLHGRNEFRVVVS